MKKLLIIQVAGLGADFAKANGLDNILGIKLAGTGGIFPALTCSAQAGFRTGSDVSTHGMPGNGYFDRKLRRTYFWEQSARLVEGKRIWDGFSARGGKTAMLFWQQSLGETTDFALSPAPVHKHHGGMIENTYSKPGDLYARLRAEVGRDFKLKDYWGPLASVKASEWIAEATRAMVSNEGLCPDLCLTYLPALDYDLQRYGPDSRKARAAAGALRSQLESLTLAARDAGMEVVIFGDYAIAPVDGAVLPNLNLANEGLLKTNSIKGMLYPDLHESPAFCVVDHEVGHVYLKDATVLEQVRDVLACVPGIDAVLDRDAQKQMGMACERAGDLLLMASEGKWLAYPWWADNGVAPEYAAHVDIHSKPGYDPCELFFGWHPMRTGMDATRIKGSHGRVGAGREVAWGSSCDLGTEISDLLALSRGVGRWLDEGAE
jgi:predicted AlkP superfamily pyrophosphatase or phosphodiesterase